MAAKARFLGGLKNEVQASNVSAPWRGIRARSRDRCAVDLESEREPRSRARVDLLQLGSMSRREGLPTDPGLHRHHEP